MPDVSAGEAIRRFRVDRGYSKSKVAAILGIHRSAYTRLEKPQANPTMRTLGPLVPHGLRILLCPITCEDPTHNHIERTHDAR